MSGRHDAVVAGRVDALRLTRVAAWGARRFDGCFRNPLYSISPFLLSEFPGSNHTINFRQFNQDGMTPVVGSRRLPIVDVIQHFPQPYSSTSTTSRSQYHRTSPAKTDRSNDRKGFE